MNYYSPIKEAKEQKQNSKVHQQLPLEHQTRTHNSSQHKLNLRNNHISKATKKAKDPQPQRTNAESTRRPTRSKSKLHNKLLPQAQPLQRRTKQTCKQYPFTSSEESKETQKKSRTSSKQTPSTSPTPQKENKAKLANNLRSQAAQNPNKIHKKSKASSKPKLSNKQQSPKSHKNQIHRQAPINSQTPLPTNITAPPIFTN